MAEANVLNQYIATKLLGPQVQAKLLAAQQQQELAKAILEQGATPLDLKDRQIGGVGYAISPLEGLGKMAQMLSGKYQQGKANDAYANAFNVPADSSAPAIQGAQGQGGLNTSGLGGWANGLNPLDVMEVYNGNRAVAEMLKPTEQQKNFGQGSPAFNSWVNNQTNPGAVSYQNKLGEQAAGNAPAGQLPPGIGSAQITPPPQGQDQLPPVPPAIQNGVNSSPAGQAMNAQVIPPPPTAAVSPMSLPAAFSAPPVGHVDTPGVMPSPMPNESQNQYMARLDAAKAGATAQATEAGKAQGESNVNLAQINSRIENAKKNVQEMLQIADKTSTAVPLVPEDLQHKYINRFDPNTAKANTRFEQLNNQIYVQELGPLIKQLGSRGNMFVERAVKAGSAIDIGDHPEAKKVALKGILEYLDNIQGNAANQQAILSGSAPNQPVPATNSGNGWSITKVR